MPQNPVASPAVSSTVGIRNVVIAPLTEDTETTLTYGDLQLLAGAIDVQISPDNAEPEVQYADDEEFDVVYPDPEIKVTMEQADLPLAIQEMILGNTIDDNGVLVRKAGDKPGYFALGFKSERGALNGSTMRPIGVNAMSGLALGIRSGRASVVSAIRLVALAAVAAAKSSLKIQSPSKVFQDDVGRMMARGMAKGALLESRNQAKVIQNASRYLTGAARDGVQGISTSDNRRSYQTSNSATVNVDKLVISDKNDVRALAQEIGVVQRRAALGMGG